MKTDGYRNVAQMGHASCSSGKSLTQRCSMNGQLPCIPDKGYLGQSIDAIENHGRRARQQGPASGSLLLIHSNSIER